MEKLPLVLFGCGTCVFFVVGAILSQGIPTLNHMMNIRNSAPFVTTGLNWVLAAHVGATLLMYKRMNSYIHVIGACIMYIGIAISIISFPFGYSINYTAIVTLGCIALWMVSCLAAFKTWYIEHVTERKTCLYVHTATFAAFTVSAAIYMGLKFSLQSEIGIFISELCCGLLLASFVVQMVYQNRFSDIQFTW